MRNDKPAPLIGYSNAIRIILAFISNGSVEMNPSTRCGLESDIEHLAFGMMPI